MRARATTRALALALAGLAAGCGPTLLGTCQTQADCTPSQTYCTAQGVCIPQTGGCTPTCPSPGTICNNGVCVALKSSSPTQDPLGVSAPRQDPP